LQQYINNQITSNRKVPFRVEPEQVAVSVCQALCPHFQREARKGCTSCPTGRLIERSDPRMGKSWSIILPLATLRLFPSNGVIQVIRKSRKLETKTGISAFTSSDNPFTLWVDFYNSKRRPIFGITEFGSIR